MVSLAPGVVITIPAEVKHWHGAKADSWFAHIAVEVPDTHTEWCEAVTDEAYNTLQIGMSTRTFSFCSNFLFKLYG